MSQLSIEKLPVYNYDSPGAGYGLQVGIVSAVWKLIAVLESIEKLPVYNYDSPGAGYGLQVGIVSAVCTAHIPSVQW